MTPLRSGASLTCAIPTPGEPNSDARTPHSIHIRNLIGRSLYRSRRDRHRSPGMLERYHSLYKNRVIRLPVDVDGSGGPTCGGSISDDRLLLALDARSDLIRLTPPRFDVHPNVFRLGKVERHTYNPAPVP
jgi:hypothetical protein